MRRDRAEIGLAAPLGETDGLDDAPAMSLAVFAGPRRAMRRQGIRLGFLSLIIAAAGGALLLSTVVVGIRENERLRSFEPVVHPFEIDEQRAQSIIMEVKGDPILILRRETDRPEAIALGLPQTLADGPAAIETALHVGDFMISEGGFMGKASEVGDMSLSAFAESAAAMPSAEDVYAAMTPSAEGEEAEIRVVEEPFPADALPPFLTDLPRDAVVEAAVRAFARRGGWIEGAAPRLRVGEGAAVPLRVLGSNTSSMIIRPGTDASETRGVTLSAEGEEGLAALLARNGFEANAAATVEQAFGALYRSGRVVAGSRVFARGIAERAGEPMRPVQVALWDKADYVGTVALGDDGSYGAGAEPWSGEARGSGGAAGAAAGGGYTIADGVYSAALRHDVPEPIVREALQLLSRATDLNAALQPGERMDLVYLAEPRDEAAGAGRVIYVGLRRRTGATDCYVFRAGPSQPFGCMEPGGGQVSRPGMIAPVKVGRLTSRFGYRFHPILKIQRLHKGIDWGAPMGTPIMAVANGTVAFAGVSRGYGNYVKIAHNRHATTAYAHMQAIEAGITAGVPVTQGQRIGYLGSTGMSTGPHLHFELYLDGQPVDPLTHDLGDTAEAAAGATPPAAGVGATTPTTATPAPEAAAPAPPPVSQAYTDRKAVIDAALRRLGVN